MVKVPDDRTTKQKLRGYCYNPECRDKGDRFEFEVDHDGFACPKCGADETPMVGLLVLTHLLLPDPKGKIVGAQGIRYRQACDGERTRIATTTNMEAGSGEISVVNCQGCLASPEAKAKQKPRIFGA